MQRRLTYLYYLGFVAVACIAFVRHDSFQPSSLRFAEAEYAKSPVSLEEEAFFYSSFIQPEDGPPSVHASTITESPNGDLLAAWFGGSREGAKDVKIYCTRSKKDTGKWLAPTIVASPKQTTEDLNRYIKKLGNPILFADSRGRVWLFYVTVSFGGWSGSSITVRYSDDDGTTWSSAERLVTSPFLNVSTLVKGKPIECESGHLLLPVYHEFLKKFSEVLTLSPEGKLLKKTRITHKMGAIQPWLVPIDETRSKAFYRQTENPERMTLGNAIPNIFRAERDEVASLSVPNPKSAVAVIRTNQGQYLMACNPIKQGRHRLSLQISDDGNNWNALYDVELGKHLDEFSYPYLSKDKLGHYHLTYTWNRKKIRYATFNDAWLTQQGDKL